MSPLELYLLTKPQRPLDGVRLTLAQVLPELHLHASLHHVRAVDIATPRNSIELVSAGTETALVFDHNYFQYIQDVLLCFLSDCDGVETHLRYVVHRFLLEESLRYNVWDLSCGFLHAILEDDPSGRNPLGRADFALAETITKSLQPLVDFQFKFCAAHEIGHAALRQDPTVREDAIRRLRYLCGGLNANHRDAQHGAAATEDGADLTSARWLADVAAHLERGMTAADETRDREQSAQRRPDSQDPMLEEFLCDNLAAEALGVAAAAGRIKVGLVGYDLVFALDALFLLMWFLEGLRAGLAALFPEAQGSQAAQATPDDQTGQSTTGPEVAYMRGHLATFQFLLSYLAEAGLSAEQLEEELQASSETVDKLAEWLQDLLHTVLSAASLERCARLGHRHRTLFNLTPAQVHRGALSALGWR